MAICDRKCSAERPAADVCQWCDSQPSTVYTGNVPNAGTATGATVNLQDNNFPVKIGKQNSDANPFYYEGNIGNMALYNRPLTANEIQQNYLSYSA